MGGRGSSSGMSGGRRVVINGKDLTGTWWWDPDTEEFAIDSILHAQGFDGLPRVVSADEFDAIYTGEQPLLLRTFSAPDDETLQAYDDMLKNGKFYVDCSTGGAQYGQGMYAAGIYGAKGSKTAQRQYDGAMEEMVHYQTISGRDGMKSKIETMTLDPSARIVNLSDLKKDPEYKKFTKERNRQIQERFMDEWAGKAKDTIFRADYIPASEKASLLKSIDEASGMYKAGKHSKARDILVDVTDRGSSYELGHKYDAFGPESGSTQLGRLRKNTSQKYGGLNSAHEIATEGIYAAAKGYDAINARGHGSSGSYTIVLNRTKLVISD